jgi:hypothetical protein
MIDDGRVAGGSPEQSTTVARTDGAVVVVDAAVVVEVVDTLAVDDGLAELEGAGLVEEGALDGGV